MRQAVDRSLVHKNSADQVMLLTAELGEDGSMRLGVGLPTTHPSADMLPSCSTLLGVELMRQCAIVFAHLGAGVPRDWAFLMNEITFTWQDGHIPETAAGFAGEADVRVHAVKTRKGQVSDLQLEVEYIRGGVTRGRGSGDFSVLAPRSYQAVRRNAPTEAAESTGPLGQVLAGVRKEPGTLEAGLVWNLEDRFMFDHPSDHVPGMLMANALLQGHLLLTGEQAVGFRLRCVGFAEHGTEVHIGSDLTGPGQSRISITQAGKEIAVGHGNGPRTGRTSSGSFHRRLATEPSHA
ncbi:AfsA-related hotdog domain-containing protein [Arthrobacter rhombi]|uniref:AfsA-related hotdog domain-containing protein n=1 Tax=Arthrobacter rhombi TaxID=71253 RepID=UPI003FD464F3